MKAHWQYFQYVVRHKWFVLLAGVKLGVPLWQLILHDWDKFLPDEWFPYVASFYGKQGRTPGVRLAFDYAWLLHQKRNKHHHQWWLLPEDDGGTKILEMPPNHAREMLADWMGAGRAVGKPDTLMWYLKNSGKMRLHPLTREWIEERLAVPLTDKFQAGGKINAPV